MLSLILCGLWIMLTVHLTISHPKLSLYIRVPRMLGSQTISIHIRKNQSSDRFKSHLIIPSGASVSLVMYGVHTSHLRELSIVNHLLLILKSLSFGLILACAIHTLYR